MKITPLSRVEDIPESGAVFLALGNFDGVHRGHQALLSAAVEGADALSTKERPVRPAVFTFRTGKAPLLTTEEERMALFAQAGIDEVFVAEFDAFKGQSPQVFVEHMLPSLGAVGVVCGFNFRFGHYAAGDVDLLCRGTADLGIACRVIEAIQTDGVTVSSTEIRRRLSQGDLEGVAALLGRPWSIRATVVHGRAVGGKLLSSPTLNLPLTQSRQLPPYGVYFTQAVIEGRSYPAITNLGVRPTFGDSELLCETHLLGATGNFYGLSAEIRFLKFRRAERRFASADELSATIAADIAAANAYFARQAAALPTQQG